MSPTAVPKLKKTALVKVSVIIYKSSEFRNEYNRLRDCNVKPFQLVRSNVLEKLADILPYKIKEDVSCCLKHIHNDVLQFARECSMRIDNLNGFCWKSDGYLNRYQTVKRLFKNPELFDKMHLIMLQMLASNQLEDFLS